MNLDLYTEEFRNFKYLKSDAESVEYFRKNYSVLQKVQPWAQINDPNFVWETRLEFLEQLFDLRDDVVYFIIPPLVTDSNLYEDSRMYEISEPFIYKGKAFQMENEASLADISSIEESALGFYLSSRKYSLVDRLFLTMESCPLIPSNGFVEYSAMFYDREWALKYKDAITYFCRKNFDAMTAMTRAF
jgi:hypothetical protein